jgi:DNA-binding Xre family transcriptional regulator
MIIIRLKELAEAKDLNQSQVQRQTGLTMGLVRRYWFNETEEVKLSAIDKICELLSCDPGDLITRTTNTP